MQAYRAARFRHLHQRQNALLHSGAACRRKADNRQTVLCGVLKQTRDLLADNRAHAAHHKMRIHAEHGAVLAHYLCGAADDGFLFSGRKARAFQFIFVVRKLQNVMTRHVGIELRKRIVVRQKADALACRHAKMVAAAADVQVVPKLGDRGLRAALRACHCDLVLLLLRVFQLFSALFQLILGRAEQTHQIHNGLLPSVNELPQPSRFLMKSV